VTRWKTLQGHIDEDHYRNILARFEFQAGEAIKWRDTINGWISHLSGIPDQTARVATQP
jgi:alpha-glucuronidase